MIFFVIAIAILNIVFVDVFAVVARAEHVVAAASCPLATGKPYRSPNVPTVFLVTPECTKRPFFNPAVYLSFFTDWSSVVFIEQWEMDRIPNDALNFLPWGPLRTFGNGSIVKITSDPRVYLILDGKAYPFEDEETFKSLGYAFDQVEDVAAAVLNTFTKQSQTIKGADDVPVFLVFKYENDPRVYLLKQEGGVLIKSHILSMDDLKLVFRSDRIATLPANRIFADGADTGSVAPEVPVIIPQRSLFSLNLAEGVSTVSGSLKLQVMANGASASSVQFIIGGTLVGTATSSLNAVSVDTKRFSNGSYQLTVAVIDTSGNTTIITRTLTINNVEVVNNVGGGGGGGGGSTTVADTAAPVVATFSLPTSSTNLTISITAFTATDNTAVTGYLVNESATTPSAGASGWTSSVPTSYSFADSGSKTLYAWVKDAAGNISASLSATTTVVDATVPVISGVASSTSLTSATITWTTDEASTSTVQYGTTTGYGSTSSSAATTTAHSVSLTGLTSDTVYHFKVSSQDASGNVASSTDYTFRTTVADITPPVISAIASSTGLTTAVITWTTDEASTSTVSYGLTTGYGSTSSSASSVTSHSVSLTGLTSDTTYHFKVSSQDASGNVASSTDYTFRTTDGVSPTVTAFTVPATSNSRTISITAFTATDNTAVTGYLVNESAATPSAGDAGWSASPQSSYIFTTDGSKTLYAWAKDAQNNISTSLSDSVAVDTAVPVISSVASSTGLTTATITWTTDEASTSTVQYGTTTGYGSTSSSAVSTTSHSISLTGLTSDTTYHFKVASQDASGNVASSTDYTFRTTVVSDTTAPIISSVASSTGATTATITWTTDEASTSTVQYGATTGYGSTSSSASSVTSHSVSLTGLTSDTVYHFKVSSQDASGNVASSTDYTFRTVASDSVPPVISSIASSTGLTTATITWTTDEASTSTVQYGLTTGYGSSSSSASSVTSHSISLTGLSSGATYHFKVSSQDASGNVASSTDYTFRTTSVGAVESITAMPRLGVGSPSYSNVGTASLINDGQYKLPYTWAISGCSAASPCWNAVNVGSGPSKLLLQFSYEENNGMFSGSSIVGNYSILVSNDSTNGSNGTWTTSTDSFSGQPVSITGNPYVTRAHEIDFTGYSWIKLVVTSSTAPTIDEIDMWDASVSTEDTYFFNGDSITARCVTRGTSAGWDEQPCFQADIAAISSDHFPMVTNGGSVGLGSEFADDNINAYLAAFPMTKYWVYTMGTNDLCYSTPEQYSASVQSWITKVKNAGRVPILAHPIWGNDVTDYCYQNGPSFNAVIDALITSNDLLSAVPLYEQTFGHYEYFSAGDVHPNADGCRAWNQIFADYLEPFYVADTTAPVISSVASSTGLTTATITWTTNEASTSTVQYGTTTGYGSTSSSASSVTSHSISLTGLSSDTVYHFKVSSQDASGNVASSTDYTFRTTAPDITPPVISSVASSTGLTTATITWTTDEASTSTVFYGLTTGYGSTSSSASSVTSHSISLTGLNAGTAYHFKVSSQDASGNVASSTDYIFTTIAPDSIPPVISSVASSTGLTTATITWTTDEASTSTVFYGLTTGYGSTSSSASSVTSHSISLTGLSIDTVYHFKVSSQDASGNVASSTDYTFRTLPDTTAPVISAVASSTSLTSATITWTTDEASTSTVSYGLTTGYGSTSSSALSVTSHSISLTGLSAGTAYHFKVSSQDASGNVASSTDYTFLTAPPDITPPVISAMTTTTGQTTAVITWTTDEASTSTVQYGLTTGYGSTSSSVISTTSHSITITGLTVSTTYHFKVSSQDASGNVASSTDYTFRTCDMCTLAPMPLAMNYMNGFDMIRNGTEDYIYASPGEYNTSFYRYSISGNSWTSLTAMPASTYTGASMIRADGEDLIYLIRGASQPSFYRYSISGNSWETLTAAPSGVYINGNSMILRSGTEDSIYLIPGSSTSSFYKYSIAGNSWTSLTNLPFIPGDGMNMIRYASEDYIYVAASSTLFYRYSISGNSWTALTSLPGSIGLGSTMIRYQNDNDIYFLRAGYSTGFYKYSISGNSWSTLASAPDTIMSPRVTLVRNGSSNDMYAYGPAWGRAFYKYSISENSWTTVGNTSGTVGTDAKIITNVGDDVVYIKPGASNSFEKYNFEPAAPAPDSTAPVISSVASSTGLTTATITWTTDEASTSTVQYGATASYGSTSSSALSVTSHSITITGLTVSTTYHFKVSSQDASGNVASSTDYTFQTLPDTTAPVISAVASSTGLTTATITWTTDEASTSTVQYGTTTGYGSTSSSAVSTTSHTISLTGLSSGTTYHFKVSSQDAYGNVASSTDYTFSTVAPDSTAPVISAVASSTGLTTAVITWTTDEASTSTVSYGLTTGYGSTSSSASSVTSHSIALADLTIDTIYHFKVSSQDASGNVASSTDYTFRTLPDTTAPVISSVASSTGLTTATITWTTDEASTSTVSYGLTTGYGSTSSSVISTTSHSITITDLSSDTVYHFKVSSQDASGNVASSTDYTFSTVAPDSTPPIIASISTSTGQTTATITWTTDEASTSTVQYGTTTGYGSTSSSVLSVTSHSITITGLTVSTTYHFKVSSQDASGNVASSTDYTFQTCDMCTLASLPTSSGSGFDMIRNGTEDYIYSVPGEYSTTFYRYSVSGNAWTSLAAIPGGAYTGASMIRADGEDFIYLTRGGAQTSFYRYSISGNSWTTLTPAPANIYQSGKSTILRSGTEDLIYLMPGYGTSSFYSYSISGNSWTALTNLPFVPGDGMNMIRYASEDYIYVAASSTSFYRYSISGNSWTALTNLPGGIGTGSTLVRYENSDDIYFLRGNYSGGFYKYSISGNSWTTLTSAPGGDIYQARVALVRNGSSDDMYVFGKAWGTAFYKYSISGNSWTTVGTAPGAVDTDSKVITNVGDDSVYLKPGGSTVFAKYAF